MKLFVRVVDSKGAEVSNMSQSCLEPHACAGESDIKCETLTTLRKICVRRGVLSSKFTSSAAICTSTW